MPGKAYRGRVFKNAKFLSSAEDGGCDETSKLTGTVTKAETELGNDSVSLKREYEKTTKREVTFANLIFREVEVESP